MFRSLRDYLYRKELEKHGITLMGLSGFSKSLRLEVESPVSLRNVELSTFHPDRVSFIGSHTYIRSECVFSSFGRIGRYCSIARGVLCGASNHPLDFFTTHPFVRNKEAYSLFPDRVVPKSVQKEPPVIGNDVWIGNNAIIMPGVSIGDGAVIAAGAVVTHDVEPYEVVGGVPAHHLKYRFEPDIIARLLEVKWWNYDPRYLVQVDPKDIDGLCKLIEKGDVPEYKPKRYVITRTKLSFEG